MSSVNYHVIELSCDMQVRVAVVGGGTGEVLMEAGVTPEFTATKVNSISSIPNTYTNITVKITGS